MRTNHCVNDQQRYILEQSWKYKFASKKAQNIPIFYSIERLTHSVVIQTIATFLASV
jgi:hypothetical protein